MPDAWISVKDRLPEGMVLVLAHSPGFVPIIAYWFCDVWMDRSTFEQVGDFRPITHWRPLPDPPKE